jgi:xylulose-5-phosphate/fructose-6-phosphate phosphoketolase
MIYLRSNTLLSEDLQASHIKPRLLGHWGTCPGLVLVYAHANRLIRKLDLDAILVVGPGHGAPAILSCLWLEDSIAPFYPSYTRDKPGLDRLITGFSAPGGFPRFVLPSHLHVFAADLQFRSHINAETPGCIHEGGELGYALAVAFGAVMDNPDLIAICVVGDGEAETGPTAT